MDSNSPSEVEVEQKPPRSVRSKLIAGLLLLPLVVLAVGGFLWYSNFATLESQLAAIRAQGLPTTTSELNDFYAIPEGVTDATGAWRKAIEAVMAADISAKTLRERIPILGPTPIPIPISGQTWADLDASRAFLAKLEPELQLIRQATDAGGNVRYPVDFTAGIATPIPFTINSRQVGRLLQLDAYVSAHDGNSGRVLQDIQGMFVLADTLRYEPILISLLTRISLLNVAGETLIRLMPHCHWSDAELESLQTAIRSARFQEELRRSLSGERVICLWGLDQMPLGPLRVSNQTEMLRFYESTIHNCSFPWPDAIDRQREITAELTVLKTGRLTRFRLVGVHLLLPDIQQTIIAGARAEARLKCLNAVIAVERYRLKHGRLPESLSAIDPELLGDPSTPIADLTDPFDGRPIRYKVSDTAFTVYSVGENKQDDGGDCEPREQGEPPDVGYSLLKQK